MNIQVKVERLVLEGLPVTGAQAPRLQAAFEVELGRLLFEAGQSAEALPRSIGSLPADSIRVPASAGPAAMGRQIARAVFRSIRQGSESE